MSNYTYTRDGKTVELYEVEGKRPYALRIDGAPQQEFVSMEAREAYADWHFNLGGWARRTETHATVDGVTLPTRTPIAELNRRWEFARKALHGDDNV